MEICTFKLCVRKTVVTVLLFNYSHFKQLVEMMAKKVWLIFPSSHITSHDYGVLWVFNFNEVPPAAKTH